MILKTTTEKIICPECGKVQKAKIKHTRPFHTYIHECKKCKYNIMESEWLRVDNNNEKNKI